ncbi:phasin family protein [Oceanibacterium hippocampi]|uniref:Phasin protein n=1 Tax=Oceanibacterium hippocampi TaxID=745714 RepID=A0A1Y5SLJ7_9PROT|nr:phasin family protein [Oceanibacterium hippocampi]SLN43591.1 Phasin protein [Oceanibacterium hippocampi]
MATAKKNSTETVTGNFEEIVEAGKETIESAIKAGTEAASGQYQKAFAVSQESLDATVRAYSDIAGVNKEQLEAVVAAGKLAAEGGEKVNAEILSMTRTAVDDYFTLARSLVGVKTVKEAFELQSAFAKNVYESYVQGATRISSLGVEVAQAAVEPMGKQFTASVEKFMKPMSA